MNCGVILLEILNNNEEETKNKTNKKRVPASSLYSMFSLDKQKGGSFRSYQIRTSFQAFWGA